MDNRKYNCKKRVWEKNKQLIVCTLALIHNKYNIMPKLHISKQPMFGADHQKIYIRHLTTLFTKCTTVMIRSVLRDQTTRRLQGNRHDADVRDDPSKISCRGFRSKTASSQLTGNLYKCNRLTLICD